MPTMSSPTTVSMGQPLTTSSSSYPPPSSSDGRVAGAVPLPFRKDGRANPESQCQPRSRALTGEPLLPPTNNGDDEASIRAATAMIAMRQRWSRRLGSTQPSAQSIFGSKRAFNATTASCGGSGIVLDSPINAIAHDDSATATTSSPVAADRGQTSSGGGEGGITPVDPDVRSRPPSQGQEKLHFPVKVRPSKSEESKEVKVRIPSVYEKVGK